MHTDEQRGQELLVVSCWKKRSHERDERVVSRERKGTTKKNERYESRGGARGEELGASEKRPAKGHGKGRKSGEGDS
jgi:hypothetical protein